MALITSLWQIRYDDRGETGWEIVDGTPVLEVDLPQEMGMNNHGSEPMMRTSIWISQLGESLLISRS